MNFFKNYISTLFFIALASIFYWKNPSFQSFVGGDLKFNFIPNITFSIWYVFYAIILCYTLFLIPFYTYYTTPSKARIVLGYFKNILLGNGKINEVEKIALLAWCVKLFFLPLMIVWLSQHIFNLSNGIYGGIVDISLFSKDFLTYFNAHLFWIILNAILFFDVFFFTLGYMLEAPFLKNTIKSVEPTLLGWAVALLCYPPLNGKVTQTIGWYSTDFPQFGNMYLHIFFNILILILMGIYAWASFALGFKASNLTNRGIVMKGPYKYIRHPAYICKNTAWLIGGIPMIYASFGNPEINTYAVLLGLSGWAFLYYMRAMTEEAHLSADPDYLIYKNKVPYKFIPKVW